MLITCVQDSYEVQWWTKWKGAFARKHKTVGGFGKQTC